MQTQFVEHVHEVDDDRDVDVAFAGLEADPVDLVVGAVDQRHPGAAMFGVATLGLVEDPADHFRWRLDDAGGQPLVGSDRARRGLMAFGGGGGEDVGRGAGRWLGVVD